MIHNFECFFVEVFRYTSNCFSRLDTINIYTYIDTDNNHYK